MKIITKACRLLALGIALAGSFNVAAQMTLEEAINAEYREDRAMRDVYRHPKETLEFFGLKNDMKVVEIWPGGGWYLEILAPYLKANGDYVAAHFHIDADSRDYFKKSRTKFEQKLQTDPVYSGVTATAFHPVKDLKITADGSADMVLTFRNLHNWYMREGDAGIAKTLETFYRALKSGGVLGVVEHRMPENFDQEKDKGSGYMKQSYVIAAAEKAGFKLAATSEINANKKDTADHPKGVWTLPPRLRLGDQDKDKYLTIGESDRMTLKFIKP